MPRNRATRYGRIHPESGQICFARVGEGDDIKFESAILENTEIHNIIEEDKKYGTFEPRNGKFFTYRVLNEDVEITNKQVLKSVQYAYRRISIRTHLKFRRAREGEYADLRIEFRTVESDPDKQLQPNTLMYHYYPINSYTNKFRGLCVVNKKYFWTTHGRSLPLDVIDPTNYPEPTDSYGRSFDFDQVYTHEALHGLGLPHSKESGNVMSPSYGQMAEWMSDEDIARITAKYGSRGLSEHKVKRWLRWLLHASNR